MRAIVVMVMVGLSASVICADDVEARFGKSYMRYSGVRITDFADGQVKFTLAGSWSLTKKLDDIKTISIKALPTFGQAEQLAAKGTNWPLAVKGYDQAAKTATRRWQKDLIAVRRLHALDQGGMTDRAVKEWLVLADAKGGSAWVLSARPTQQAKKGYPANAAAITMLERKRIIGKRSKQYQVAIVEVLMGLYNREGQTAKASALAEWLRSGGNVAIPPANGNGGGTPQAGGSLESIEMLLKGDKPDRALKFIEEDLHKYTRPQLPKAMLLRGMAQLQIAKTKTDQARSMLLVRAGLNFMRVVVADPKSPEAPEALFQAGMIHTMLAKPNLRAARAAYNKVISDYGRNPAAAKARKALASL